MTDNTDLANKVFACAYNSFADAIDKIDIEFIETTDGNVIYIEALRAVSKVIGEMIAACPEENREGIEEWFAEGVKLYTEEAVELATTAPTERIDLATAKPAGNA